MGRNGILKEGTSGLAFINKGLGTFLRSLFSPKTTATLYSHFGGSTALVSLSCLPWLHFCFLLSKGFLRISFETPKQALLFLASKAIVASLARDRNLLIPRYGSIFGSTSRYQPGISPEFYSGEALFCGFDSLGSFFIFELYCKSACIRNKSMGIRA